MLLRLYIWRQILQWLAWRAFLFTLVINQAITPLAGLAVWSVALPSNDGISTYYLMILIVQLMTVSYENHTFSNSIYDGTVTSDLLKPQPIVLATIGENIAVRLLHLLIGLPVIIVAALIYDVTTTPQLVFIASPAIALAAVLRFLFTYVLALSAFWTQQAHGLVSFGTTMIFLFGGVAAPIPLMPTAIQPWIAVLPFRSMLGFPAELASGQLASAQVALGYWWQIVWLVLLIFTASALWRFGTRHFTAIGG